MGFGTLHHFRIVLAASVGIAVALAVVIGFVLGLRPDPKTLRLADRIDASRALAYIATSDRETFFRSVERFQSVMGDMTPKENDVVIADRYEYALLRTGSGNIAWVIYGKHDGEGTHTTLVSHNDPSMFLKLSERARSIGRSPLFSYLTPAHTDYSWFTIDALPLPSTPASAMVSAMLSPYKEGLLIHDGDMEGRLLLRGPTLKGNSNDVRGRDGIAISIGDPSAIIDVTSKALADQSPAFAEGLLGILRAKAEALAGSSDVAMMTKEFMDGPMTFAMKPTDVGAAMAVAGTAKNAKVFDTLLTAMASMATEGSLRRMKFPEYTRTDVTRDSSGIQSIGAHGAWSLRRLGGTGSDVAMIAAHENRRYVLGNHEGFVMELLDAERTDGGLGTGTVDLAWFSSEMDERLPFLHVSPTTEMLFGTAARLTWRIYPLSSGIGIEWSLSGTR